MRRRRTTRAAFVPVSVAALAVVSCTSILGDFSVGDGEPGGTGKPDASCTGASCTTGGGSTDGSTPVIPADASLGSLTLSPTSVSLARGDMVQIAVGLGNPSASPVDVYLVDPPAGVTADPLRIPAGSVSGTLVLHVSLAAMAAVHAITVAASVAGRTAVDAGGTVVDAGGAVDSGAAGDGGEAGVHDAGAAPVVDAGPPVLPAGAVTAIFTLTVEGTNGGIDVTFGTMGTLLIHVSAGSDIPSGIVFDSQGRALIVGTRSMPTVQALVTRLTEAGAVDTSFGTMGFAAITGLAQSVGGAIAVGAGDALFVGGSTTAPGTASALIASFTAAGQLDTSFASGRGYVSIDSGGGADTINGVANLAGTLVIGGSRTLGSSTVGLLAGFSSTGLFSGEATTSSATVIAVGGFAADGAALWLPALSSSGGTGNDTLALGRSGSGSAHFDTTFAAASGGFAKSVFSGSAFTGDARAAVQSTGRVIVGGTPVSGSTGLVGFTAAGALDTTFGTAGIASTDTGSAADIAVDSADRVLVAGDSGGTANLLRFTSAGALDPDFADGFPTGQTFPPSALTRVAVDSKGRIWAIGHGQMTAGDDDWLVARFLP